MNRRMSQTHHRAVRALGTALLLLVALNSAWADGVLLALSRETDGDESARITVPLRRAVVFRPNQDEMTLLLQPVYRGPVTEFCWLIPTPVAPDPDDVFTASGEFMDAVFRRTAPLIETEILDVTSWQPFLRPVPGGAPTLTQSLSERDVGPGERLDVRWYESVLLPQGEGPDDVRRWLEANGYEVDETLARACRDYVQRGWHFVALRILPASTGTGPAMKYVTPVGIRLETQQAIYPLGFAAASAPEHTVVQVAVIAPVPVECGELPVVTVPRRTVLPPGRWYEEFRETHGAGGLVKEAQALGVHPFSDLSYWADHWTDASRYSWEHLWTTRFSGRLSPDRLVDLAFVSARDAGPFRVHIYRRASAPTTGLGLLRTGAGRFVAVWVLVIACGAVLWAGGWVAEQRTGRPAGAQRGMPSWRFLLRLPVYGGWMLLLSPAVLALYGGLDQLPGPRLFLGGQLPAGSTRLWAVLLIVWATLAVRLVVMEIRASGGGRLFAALFTAFALPWLIAVLLSPSPSLRLAAGLGEPAALAAARAGAVAAILGFASVLSWIVHTVILGPNRFRWMAAEFAVVMLVVLGFSPLLYSRGSGAGASTSTAWSTSLAQARHAVARFRCERQAFPAEPASLTEEGPAFAGLDVARNVIPDSGAPNRRATLASIPIDPLTGRPNWLYDPTMPERIASAAFTTTVDRARYDAAKPQPPASYWSAPTQGDLRAALGRVRRVVWGSGDTLVRASGSAATGPALSAVDVAAMSAACVLSDNARRLRALQISAPGGAGHLLLSSEVRSPEKLSGATDSPRSSGGHPRCAVFSVTGPVLQMQAMGAPIAGRMNALEASPDGLRAACVLREVLHCPGDRSLWVLDASGMWLGPLAHDVARVAWHPSGDYLLALITVSDPARGEGVQRCRLLRVDCNGATKVIRTEPRYLPDVLVVSYGRAFVRDGAGHLLGIELATGKEKTYTGLGGEVLDLLHVGAGKVAALVGSAVSEGSRKTGRLRFLDSPPPVPEPRRSRRGRTRARSGPRPIDRVAPEGVKWTDGRIVGAYGGSGYHFLHLWSEDDPVGVIVMVAENGAPPQELPVVVDGEQTEE